MVRLSVILPGYKTPNAWWMRAIHSVLAAITSEDELICVDDGDVDAVWLDELCREYQTIRVLHQPNRKLAVARNHGIDTSRGEFVTFVDSDDEVLNDIYNRALAGDKKDIVLFGVRSVWEKERYTRDDIPMEHPRGILYPSAVRELADNGLLYYAWNKIYRKPFLEILNLRFHPQGMPCEDVALNLLCLANNARVRTFCEVGYLYRRRIDSLLSRYNPDYEAGIRVGQAAWKTYGYGKEAFFHTEVYRGESWIKWRVWDNINAKGSPYSLRERVAWLRRHRRLLLADYDGGWQLKLLRHSPWLLLWCYLCIHSVSHLTWTRRCVRRWRSK